MLNVKRAADRLGLQPATIRAWIAARKLGFVRLGTRAVRIPEAEIEKLIQRGFVPPREGRRGQ